MSTLGALRADFTALAAASLRFSLGRGNTVAEVDAVAGAVVSEVTRLRAARVR